MKLINTMIGIIFYIPLIILWAIIDIIRGK